jgi:hypothetical protein
VSGKGVKAPQTITFPALADVKYGAPDTTLGATADSGLPITYSIATPDTCQLVAGKVRTVRVGICTVNADQYGDGTYLRAPRVAESFEITRSPLVVTPTNATGPYGTVPAVNARYAGFKFGETESVLQTAATCVANTNTTTLPGTYENTSTCSGAEATNYTFTYRLGTVTITKAPVTLVTSASHASDFASSGKIAFRTTATNAANNARIAGLVVTIRVAINSSESVTCTATTDVNGIASCASSDSRLASLIYPRGYSATSSATSKYLEAKTQGTIPN